MSTGRTIIPQSIGEDGIEPGAETREFLSFCPPEMQPSRRIIAQRGPNDWQDIASPENDSSTHQPSGESSTLIPDPTAALGFTGSIGRGYQNVVKGKARIYMDSFPGPDNTGANAVHSRLKQLLTGKKCHEEVLVYLNDNLDYRLAAMQLASRYVSFLELQFPDGLTFDTEAWCNDLALKAVNDDCSTDAQSKLEKYKQVRGYIMDTDLFGRPMVGQGFWYTKPTEYLAIALVESSSLSIDDICDTIDRLVRRESYPPWLLATLIPGFSQGSNVRRIMEWCFMCSGEAFGSISCLGTYSVFSI
jgi:hypothetical protein